MYEKIITTKTQEGTVKQDDRETASKKTKRLQGTLEEGMNEHFI